MIGQTVSHYNILSELGSGAMSIVYLAMDKRLKRQVAIKMLNAKQLVRGNQSRTRLLREARAISRISHPNIATIYDYGKTENGQPFIAMEYIEGETLAHVLKHNRLSVKRTLEIIASVANALSEAHRKGIIHRDVKPSNIIINKRCEVKVVDFGLAKQIQEIQVDLSESAKVYAETQTHEGVMIGTPLYLSPEQALGAPVNTQSDIFSLGSVMYECLTGRIAFQAENVIAICAKILRDDPPLPSQLNPDVTSEIDGITLKALAKDPQDRYKTALEMSHDLQISLNRLSYSDVPNGVFNLKARTQDETYFPVETKDDNVVNTQEQAIETKGSSSQSLTFRLKNLRYGKKQLLYATFGLLLFAVCVFGYIRFFSKPKPFDIQSLEFQTLSIRGDIKESVMSPNGEYVASIVEESGKQTMLLSDTKVSNDLPVSVSAKGQLKGLTFSPDSTFIYFLDYEGSSATLYSVHRLGNVQRKLLSNINTPVTFSANGSRMAFIRYNTKEQSTELITASPDGSNEKLISSRKRPAYYSLGGGTISVGPVWSPDGKQIACPVTKNTEQGDVQYLEVVNVNDGSSKPIGNKTWYLVSKIVWVADGSGLVISTVDRMLAPNQLYFLSYPYGEVSKITQEASSYETVSATRDSKTLLAVKKELSSMVWIMPSDNVQSYEPLNFTRNKGIRELAWLSGESFIYGVSRETGVHIFAEKLDGTIVNQLTFNEGDFFQPVVSSDQRFVFFTSNKSGALNLWRINADGTNQVQLTQSSYADSPSISPDGKWIFYHGHTKSSDSVWRVLSDGGNSELFINKSAHYPSVSPDGKMIAFFTWNSKQELTLYVQSVSDGKEIGSFALPSSTSINNRLRWTPDGKAVAFVVKDSEASNIWIQSLEGGKPNPLTVFKESDVMDFAWSPDGKKLACVRGVKITKAVTIKDRAQN